ncbi:hypothetical protein EDD22DRAFT_951225 [Suillus occidentalis]|nr:hypothetical protein EDD22DRAFT_951225 [Suillus occidentalis]
MSRAQNVSCQPSNLIDGHAILLVAQAIFSAPRTHSDRARTNTRNEEDQDESICSSDLNGLICSADQDELISSADSGSCDGSVDSLDLPLQAHMLTGRGRRLSAVVPVLLVADPHNDIPLLCSALYQRHVWGIRQPVVCLCCSSTGTIATAIFGWLESDQSRSAACLQAHPALAADVRSDPLMGVFDFTDTSSAINLAQFVLGLRTHFEDIKGATSIEVVDSLTPFHWRSDLPDFETQFWGQSDERVASWTHQLKSQRSFSEASSSSTPRTPSPLLEAMSSPLLPTIAEDEQFRGANIRSKLQAARFTWDEIERTRKRVTIFVLGGLITTAIRGLGDEASISNWLLERHACTIGRIKIKSELANKTEINAMVDLYDQMTASTMSKDIKDILSVAKVDSSVSDIRSELCDTKGDPNCQSNETNVLSSWKLFFIVDTRYAL